MRMSVTEAQALLQRDPPPDDLEATLARAYDDAPEEDKVAFSFLIEAELVARTARAP